MKVFFGELKEIKAVIKDSAVRIQNSAKKKELKADSGKLKAVGRKGRKMKFRPEITRVKLNPEQAVLTCACYQPTGYFGFHATGVHMQRPEGTVHHGICQADGGRVLESHMFCGFGTDLVGGVETPMLYLDLPMS